MSEYQMNISGEIGLSEFSSVDDYISLVDSKDSITVTFQNVDSDKLETLYKIFEKNDLYIKHTGGNIEGKHYIKAVKSRNS